MSYDVWLEDDEGGGTVGDWNYTSNCAPMWREAGCDLSKFSGLAAKTLAGELMKSVTVMVLYPKKYKAMNPDNGWGTYDTLLPALVELAMMCSQHPNMTVRVHS